jgi:hypothetical protein
VYGMVRYMLESKVRSTVGQPYKWATAYSGSTKPYPGTPLVSLSPPAARGYFLVATNHGNYRWMHSGQSIELDACTAYAPCQ